MPSRTSPPRSAPSRRSRRRNGGPGIPRRSPRSPAPKGGPHTVRKDLCVDRARSGNLMCGPSRGGTGARSAMVSRIVAGQAHARTAGSGSPESSVYAPPAGLESAYTAPECIPAYSRHQQERGLGSAHGTLEVVVVSSAACCRCAMIWKAMRCTSGTGRRRALPHEPSLPWPSRRVSGPGSWTRCRLRELAQIA
jgi:hypothetical protein